SDNPTIAEDYNTVCCGNLTVEEIRHGISQLKSNKSPGNDGLTSEFYKTFSQEIELLLLAVFKESLEQGELSTSMKQGIITLIPKQDKDTLSIDNWRPITLLNNDYKILALILAKHLKYGLHRLIDDCQSGFMKDRNISNNIRLVSDLIDYSELLEGDPVILFLDFHKAFDSV
ncbi:hypothetical protein LDENG_00170230, partial [Lucifuga dentata]